MKKLFPSFFLIIILCVNLAITTDAKCYSQTIQSDTGVFYLNSTKYALGISQQDTDESMSTTAFEQKQTILVDDKPCTLTTYALKEKNGGLTNYVRIRDIASLLNGTSAQFNVLWDNAINIITGQSYVSNGSEFSVPFIGDQPYTYSSAPTKLYGCPIILNAITLTDSNGGGYTYYKLRDLGRILGFNVGWSAEKGVYVESDRPYSDLKSEDTSPTVSPHKYTATEIYNQSIKYVGEITTYDKNGKEYALGTGFVISSDGNIVTNYHVIEGAYSADITVNNIKYTISSILAYDANIDLAVLKINANGLTAATICKQPVSVGSTVYAIGSSRGMTNTFSQGIITYADRIFDGVSHIQHDASITHGNSGGPLINDYGEVIGINTWGISDSQNLNFAVSADELDNLVYGSPTTLFNLFQEQSTPYGTLLSWLIENQNR